MDDQRTSGREIEAESGPRPASGPVHADSLLRHFRFRSLDAFRAVYETRSVTRAAARLGLSQPAVSQVLGGLERAVGVALFTRGSGRRLAPTEAAHRLVGDVLRAIDAMEALEATASALRRAGARLRVSAPPSLAAGFVPEVIARLRRHVPGVEIELGADAGPIAEERLADGDVDLSLSFLPATRTGLESRLLFDVAAVAAVPAGHRLAGASVLRPRDLAGQRVVTTAPGTALRRQVEALFAADGAPVPAIVEAPEETALCALATEAQAIAIVSPCIARYREGLALRPLRPTLGCPVRLQRRRGGRSPLGDAFAAEAVRLSETIAAAIEASEAPGSA